MKFCRLSIFFCLSRNANKMGKNGFILRRFPHFCCHCAFFFFEAKEDTLFPTMYGLAYASAKRIDE